MTVTNARLLAGIAQYRKGLIFGMACYSMWGLLPLYFNQLAFGFCLGSGDRKQPRTLGAPHLHVGPAVQG